MHNWSVHFGGLIHTSHFVVKLCVLMGFPNQITVFQPCQAYLLPPSLFSLLPLPPPFKKKKSDLLTYCPPENFSPCTFSLNYLTHGKLLIFSFQFFIFSKRYSDLAI